MIGQSRFALGAIAGVAIVLVAIAISTNAITSLLDDIEMTLNQEAEREALHKVVDRIEEATKELTRVQETPAGDSSAASEESNRRLGSLESSVARLTGQTGELAAAAARNSEKVAELSSKLDDLTRRLQTPNPAPVSTDDNPEMPTPADAFLGTWIMVGTRGSGETPEPGPITKIIFQKQNESIAVDIWESDPKAEAPDEKLSTELTSVTSASFTITKETLTLKRRYSFRLQDAFLFARLSEGGPQPNPAPEMLFVNTKTQTIKTEVLLGLPVATVQNMLTAWERSFRKKPKPVLTGEFPDGVGTVYVSYKSDRPVNSVVNVLVDDQPLARFDELPAKDRELVLEVEGVPVLAHQSYKGSYFENLYAKAPYDCNVVVNLVERGGGPEDTVGVSVDGTPLMPGEPFLPGDTVTLDVVGVKVPDLSKQRRGDVKPFLRQFGLRVLEIGVIPTSSIVKVASQIPKAGTLLRVGSTVQVRY